MSVLIAPDECNECVIDGRFKVRIDGEKGNMIYSK